MYIYINILYYTLYVFIYIAILNTLNICIYIHMCVCNCVCMSVFVLLCMPSTMYKGLPHLHRPKKEPVPLRLPVRRGICSLGGM